MADYQSTFTGSQIDGGVTKALTAVQPADLANVATSGAYSDLSGTPTLGTAASTDANAYATAAQGLLADSAIQPGDDAITLGSGSAIDGYVLTSDGSGNTVWESIPAGVTDYVSTRTGTTQFIYNMADTWNDALTTFTGIKMNVTDTASDASSLLMDLQVGGTSKFSVDKNGGIFSGGGSALFNNKVSITQNRILIEAGRYLGWSPIIVNSTIDGDVRLYRDAAGTLALRNGTNAQTFNLYNTYTDASNYERGFMRWNSNVLEIGTEGAGTGDLRSISIRTPPKTGAVMTVGDNYGFLSFNGAGQSTLNIYNVGLNINYRGSNRVKIDPNGNFASTVSASLLGWSTLNLTERTTDPADPSEGQMYMWLSNGTASGNDGDTMVKVTAGGVTRTKNMVFSDTTNVTGADSINNIISLTQAEYDAITPDASTLYVITA